MARGVPGASAGETPAVGRTDIPPAAVGVREARAGHVLTAQLCGGSSSGNAGPAGGNDAPALVQIQGGNAGPHGDCPERGNGDTADTSADV